MSYKLFVVEVCFVLFVLGFVFFFKQKTAYEMRISDWSSDVCSSDLSRTPDAPALLHASELRPLESTSWRELGAQVRVLAERLRALGIRPGDRVAAYMPNVPETAIAMLATTDRKSVV